MRKICGILFVLCFLSLMTTKAAAEVDTSNVSKTEFQSSGVLMSSTEFKDTFSGEPTSRKVAAFSKSDSNTSISIKDIIIDGEDISFIAVLSINNENVYLPVKGRLASSYKAQHGINSIVVDIPESVNGYSFLLFEIYNDADSKRANLLVSGDKKLSNVPHVKIYLQDENNTIYLFETEMPAIFSDLKASDYERAYKFRDALWASHLVKHETKEIPTDSTILNELGFKVRPMGLNTWTTWVNPTTFYDSFYIGSDYVQCYSLPYVEYRHVNVTSQDSTWAAAFKVAEHTNVSGYIYHGNNVFEYRNLKIAFACGDKSTFIRTYQEGRLYYIGGIFPALKGIGSKIAVSLLQKAFSSLPYGTTFLKALEYINTMASANGEVTLGSTGVNLTNRTTTAVGEKLNDYSFEECTDYNGQSNIGHYFTYQAVLQHEAVTGNTNTVGALLVEFDKYYT
ncbi:MAG TPA: hypothetical protein PK304_00965, partial [Mobilitalea sp.]|nr:hypothetical protein [Mobilitalea sp.]